MAKPLQSASIAAPGFFGLNTQESSVTLEDGFALVADNCIIDKYGRLGARKGWRYLTQTVLGVAQSGLANATGSLSAVADTGHGLTTGDTIVVSNGTSPEYNGTFTVTVTGTGTFEYTMTGTPSNSSSSITYRKVLSTADLIGMHRFIDITGTETIISWSDTAFYTGVGTLSQITVTTDNTLTTGNWQCATLNDKAYFFQSGYKPMVYDPVSGTITDIEDEHNITGTPPSGNTVLSAYGRLFVADTTTDKMTVSFSDLLNPQHWNSGSAGSINLESILVKGTDEIVGLGAQNGQLIVFCKQNIVIFGDTNSSSTFDPATLRLVEVISRVGCVARDSIQNTGLDIFFLSEDGLRSLGRVIQEKSLPMRDLSANVRDDIVQLTQSETEADIKSVYSEDNAFYLLLFPSFNRIYCFDTRAPLQNGALRVTIWDSQTQTSMLALPNAVYFSQVNGIAEYATYKDDTSTYTMKYYTTYFDFGSASQFKILKRLATTVIGGSKQDFVLKSGFDYTDSYQSYPARLEEKDVAEYGVAEYGLNNTVVAGSQGSSTITVEGTPDVHYTVDFQTTQDDDYNVPLKVWEDTDTYYYSTNDGTRTRVTLYTQDDDYSTEYETGTLVEVVRAATGGTGSVLQIGFESKINGAELSLQKLDIFVKQGRVF